MRRQWIAYPLLPRTSCPGMLPCDLLTPARTHTHLPVNASPRYECWWDMSVVPSRFIIWLPYGNIVATMLICTGTLCWVWRVGSERLCPKAWVKTRRRLVLWVTVFTLLWVFPVVKKLWDSIADDTTSAPQWLDVLHKVRRNALT